jgi:hypothetical protein
MLDSYLLAWCLVGTSFGHWLFFGSGENFCFGRASLQRAIFFLKLEVINAPGVCLGKDSIERWPKKAIVSP